MATGPAVVAQEAISAATDRLRLEQSIVTGREGRIGNLIDTDALSTHGDSDISRILRTVPSVHIREEDGFGLRPNISLRGSEPNRSAKISITEDGVPTAPAPYAAPSAYYFPHAARMSAISVVTGPDTLKEGPNTLGGALNMYTTAVPEEFSAFLSAQGGDFGSVRVLGRTGGTTEVGTMRAGAVLEAMTDRSNGFKKLDTGDATGFHIDDYMAKFSMGPASDSELDWKLRLKLHRADQRSDETYLGLSASDFAATPLMRYAASRADNFDSRREEISADMSFSIGELHGALLLYRTSFSRNWHKLERIDSQGSDVGSGKSGTSISSVLGDPDAHSEAFAIVKGKDSPAGALLTRNNNRSYFAEGAQFDASYSTRTGPADHLIRTRIRAHRDQVDRFQNYVRYSMMGGTPIRLGEDAPGSESNRIGMASAISLFASDRIVVGPWALTPALRAERITTERKRYADDDPMRQSDPNQIRRNDVFVFLPGVSVGYDFASDFNVFASVHRGFSPPSPGAAEDVEAEIATSYETGLTWNDGSLSAEAHVYYKNYDNLLGTCTVSGSSNCDPGTQFNGGRAGVLGLEVVLASQWQTASGAVFPVSLTYSHTDARFHTSFESDLDAWGQVNENDVLPNIPSDNLSLSAGARLGSISMDVSASWTGSTRTRAGQGNTPDDELIEAHTVVDLAASWEMDSRSRLSLRVKNLFDARYLAARIPAGLRPGLPRQILVGLDISS